MRCAPPPENGSRRPPLLLCLNFPFAYASRNFMPTLNWIGKEAMVNVIYCAGCLLGKDRFQAERIIVRQTPYQIKVA